MSTTFLCAFHIIIGLFLGTWFGFFIAAMCIAGGKNIDDK
jgi:hypothetical protein